MLLLIIHAIILLFTWVNEYCKKKSQILVLLFLLYKIKIVQVETNVILKTYTTLFVEETKTKNRF